MVQLKRNIKLDKKSLNALQSNAHSGVELQKIQHHLGLHPIHLHDVNTSIKDCLDEEIGIYHKKFGGIVLGYQNVKLLSDKGHIVNDSCFIHIDLLVEFFVFKPKVDKELHGIVNRKSKTHIGVLVYDTFNVSIHKPEDDESWLGNNVQIGQEILFSILHINMLSQLPYIRGRLLSIVPKTEENSPQALKNATKKPKKKKKVKHENEGTHEFVSASDIKSELDSDDSTTENKPNKKNKRKKNDNSFKGLEQSTRVESNLTFDDIKIEPDSDDNVKKKNKKKRKRNEDLFSDGNNETLENNTLESDFDGNAVKKHKKKSKKKQNQDSFTDFEQSENNETLDEIHFELDSDDNARGKKMHKKQRKNSTGFTDFDPSDRIENNENVLGKFQGEIEQDQEIQQGFVRDKQSKKKKKVKDEEGNENSMPSNLNSSVLFDGFNRKSENGMDDLESKKVKKRNRSLSEPDNLVKKHKKRSY